MIQMLNWLELKRVDWAWTPIITQRVWPRKRDGWGWRRSGARRDGSTAYIGVGPILAHLHDMGRIRVEAATDGEVVEVMKQVMRHEGLIPALESAHGFVTALKEASEMAADDLILINQSGRGDKDIFTIADALGDDRWRDFLRDKVASWETETTR